MQGISVASARQIFEVIMCLILIDVKSRPEVIFHEASADSSATVEIRFSRQVRTNTVVSA